ncbi:MAG: hypothetical protein ACC707_18915 [Thiohalomonadales bacterium]
MFRTLTIFLISFLASTSYAYADTSYAYTDNSEQRNTQSAPTPILDISLPSDTPKSFMPYYPAGSVLYLASAKESANGATSTTTASENSDSSEPPYEDHMFTANKIHKYLGIGSIAAALITVLLPKADTGPHKTFAEASALLGVAAVGTGLAYHWDDLDMSASGDPDNKHALLAGLGALGFVMATYIGPDVPHASYGALGAVSMLVGIKYNW